MEGTGALVNVTSEMLEPITTSITSNLGVLLPVGIGIMAVMIGVALIPRIIYRFF
jgi:phosphoglycerate-specific signal transduction histidine kinase